MRPERDRIRPGRWLGNRVDEGTGELGVVVVTREPRGDGREASGPDLPLRVAARGRRELIHRDSRGIGEEAVALIRGQRASRRHLAWSPRGRMKGLARYAEELLEEP